MPKEGTKLIHRLAPGALQFEVVFEVFAGRKGGEHDAEQREAMLAAQSVRVARQLLHNLAVKLVANLFVYLFLNEKRKRKTRVRMSTLSRFFFFNL